MKKGTGWKRRKLTSEELETWRAGLKATWEAKYQNTPFEKLGKTNKKRRILEEQFNKCAKCCNDMWFGEPLVLEIDHIDGDNSNDVRENLVALCPNCHSQTPTWRGNNNVGRKDQGRRKVSDEELLRHLLSRETIADGLRAAGLQPRGGNYKTANRVLQQHKNRQKL